MGDMRIAMPFTPHTDEPRLQNENDIRILLNDRLELFDMAQGLPSRRNRIVGLHEAHHGREQNRTCVDRFRVVH